MDMTTNVTGYSTVYHNWVYGGTSNTWVQAVSDSTGRYLVAITGEYCYCCIY